LDEQDLTLEFIKAGETVDNEKWKTWKKLHNVLSASWNVLLCQNPAPYFVKSLKNKGKLKRAYEFQEKFLEVLYLFRNFLRLKICFGMVGDSAKFRNLYGDSIEFGRN
jgi:hypothetical protein